MKVKQLNFYNVGPFIQFAMMLVNTTLSSKLQKRVKTHSLGLESLYKVVDKSLLPDEYSPDNYDGPTAGTCDDVLGKG